MQRIGPNALTHSFNWKSPRFAELQRQVQLQQTERIHTVNQQVSFHATNWTKCAHSLIQLEIAKVVLQRQVQLQQTENSHSESTSQFSRNELDDMRSLAHSI